MKLEIKCIKFREKNQDNKVKIYQIPDEINIWKILN